MFAQYWTVILADSLRGLWGAFIGLVPMLLGAIVVFIIGLVVAMGLSALVERVLGLLKLDSIVAKAGVEKYFKRAGVTLNIARFFGRLTYWFVQDCFILFITSIHNIFSPFLLS